MGDRERFAPARHNHKLILAEQPNAHACPIGVGPKCHSAEKTKYTPKTSNMKTTIKKSTESVQKANVIHNQKRRRAVKSPLLMLFAVTALVTPFANAQYSFKGQV
jgi:hypothetical protein